MEDERTESNRGSGIKVFIALLVGLGIGYWIGINGYIRMEEDTQQSSEEVVVETTAPVKESVSTQAAAKPARTTTTSTPNRSNCYPSEPKSTPKTLVKTGSDSNAISLVSYSQDWLDYDAQISVKNNTEFVITSITGRMIYYDMSGNMLDYQDFTKKLEIDSGMTKRFELRGYNYDEHYAYYQSEAISNAPDRVYKIEFQLKSYTYK